MKILSVNMCCMPYGLYHKIAFYQYMFSITIANIFLNMLTYFQYLFIPINLIISIFLGMHLTRLIGLILKYFGYNDYQEERLNELSNLFKKYDIITIQEIYNVYP